MKIKTILVAAALSASTLLAQPGPGRGHRGEANLDALTSVLELTDQQVTDLKAARQTFFQNELKPIMEQIRENRQALRTEMQQESPNASLVGQLQVDSAALRNQLKEKHAAHAEQLRATLTDAQRAKLAELQAAASLFPAIRQARGLSLLDAPEGGFGMGAGMRGGMGAGLMGPRGFRGPRGPKPE